VALCGRKLDGARAKKKGNEIMPFREANEHTQTFLEWRLWKGRTHSRKV
jgi:hypothetical protein